MDGEVVCTVHLKGWLQWLRAVFTSRCEVRIPITAVREMLAEFERVRGQLAKHPPDSS